MYTVQCVNYISIKLGEEKKVGESKCLRMSN